MLGASIAGLLAARILAARFDSVTIVERDPLPSGIADRQGVAHGRHAHSLLARGLQVVKGLFPRLDDEMIAHGGLRGDIQDQGRWYNEGLLLRQAPSGLMALMGSRALLEGLVRQRVRALETVTFLEELEASERRRYERLGRFPEGYLVIGDGICSFNPVYAQGMTVAALQAELLGECLDAGEAKLAQRFFEQAARINDAPWSVVVGGDMRYLEMEGTRTEQSRQAGAFMAQVHLAASSDLEVARTVVRLISLMDGAEVLQDPAFVQRVLRTTT